MADKGIVVELRLFDKGQLKALADVTLPSALGEITARGFRVIQGDGQSPWVAFPTSRYTKNGATINKPIIDVPRGLKRDIAEAILTEFQRVSEAGF